MPSSQETSNREIDARSSCFALYAVKMRRYRKRDGLSQADVGVACNVSDKLICAIENLRRLPSHDVSAKLDGLYSVDFFEEQYWHVLREAELTQGFRNYAEQEDQADSIRMYALSLIPGLFQTEAYARQVLSVGQREDRLEQMVAVRMGRQDILDRDDPPFVLVLVKESALREPVGGPEVMREQLAHLIELGRRPNITIQVIPTGAPVYVSGAFTLFGYADGPDMGYVEGAVEQGHMIEPPATVHRMAVTFDQLRGEALPVADSEELIRKIMEGL